MTVPETLGDRGRQVRPPARAHLPAAHRARLQAHLVELYPADDVPRVLERLVGLLERFLEARPPSLSEAPPLDESTALLITYPDQVTEPGVAPLRTLREFLAQHLGGTVSGVHLLPFFPATADDGFAVVDHLEVDPRLGDWADVVELGRSFWLMVDAVVNHVSDGSHWFRRWLDGDPAVADFFIALPAETDLSTVTRTRSSPLLHRFEATGGPRHVWTTFSADQVDLNYASPEVLLAMTGVLLEYVRLGARFIRLDAIGYLWKRPGTSCLHLPQTHEVVRLWRSVVDAVAPGTSLVTENRGPHPQVVAYLGNGHDEAHLVYQFPLPPLVLDAFVSQDASVLQWWLAAGRACAPSPHATFLNILGTHDGIGMRPAIGLLPEARRLRLAERVLACGGEVTQVVQADGTTDLFELNVVYLDALCDPEVSEPWWLGLRRFLTAHAVALSLPGVPALYVQALLGGRNWRAGVARTGHARAINRQRYHRGALEAELADPSSFRHRAFHGLSSLLRTRRAQPAFHPQGPLDLLDAGPSLCAFTRTGLDGVSRVLCLHNVSDQPQRFETRLDGTPRSRPPRVLAGEARLAGRAGRLAVEVPPSGFVWLRVGPRQGSERGRQ
jgi:glycosidase